MYELAVEQSLAVDHALRLYDGELEPVHHHDWKVELVVSRDDLDQIGAVVDFNWLYGLLEDCTSDLRGAVLNDCLPFVEQNSSGEAVAQLIFDRVARRVPAPVRIERVTIYRVEGIRARFTFNRARGAEPSRGAP